MSVRSRLAAAPWPVRWLGWCVALALFCWPLVLVRPWILVNVLAPALGVALARRFIVEPRERRRTGWDQRRQTELIRAARKGSLPADPSERERLRALVAEEHRRSRGVAWVGPMISAFAAAGLLLLGRDELAGGWITAGLLWYVAVGAGLAVIGRRIRAEQHRVVAVLDAPQGSGGGSRA